MYIKIILLIFIASVMIFSDNRHYFKKNNLITNY